MNSKQRRQDSRKWKYHVRLSYNKAEVNGYDNMFDWCRDTFGNGRKCAGWREAHGYIGTWWQFRDDKKAALFMMRWS
jgi:hypothetical protein